MKKEDLNPAKVLIEALPYIKQFRGQRLVVKIGGSILDESARMQMIAQDLVLLSYVGLDVVVVHGGGKHISAIMKRLGKDSEFIEGLRVTDAETMEITQMVLAGWINKNLTGAIEQEGGRAVGISGKDGSLIRARKLKHKTVDYGQVGEVEKIDPYLIEALLEKSCIPVISPIAGDGASGTLNLNGDLVAGRISGALGAEKLIYMTDVSGVYRDVNDSASLLETLQVTEIASLIAEGVIHGGMIPKLTLARELIQDKRVTTIHLISGKTPHALLVELLTDKGIGTQLI